MTSAKLGDVVIGRCLRKNNIVSDDAELPIEILNFIHNNEFRGLPLYLQGLSEKYHLHYPSIMNAELNFDVRKTLPWPQQIMHVSKVDKKNVDIRMMLVPKVIIVQELADKGWPEIAEIESEENEQALSGRFIDLLYNRYFIYCSAS